MQARGNGYGESELGMAAEPKDVQADGSWGQGVMGIEGADELDRATRYPAGNSSAAGAVANFVNTIIGTGIVVLPFALAQVCSPFGQVLWDISVGIDRKLGRKLVGTQNVSAVSTRIILMTEQKGFDDKKCLNEVHEK